MAEPVGRSAARLATSQFLVSGVTAGLSWLMLRAAAPADVALIPLTAMLGGFAGVALKLGSGTQLVRQVPRLLENPTADRRVEHVAGASLRASVIGTLICLPLALIVGRWLALGPLAGRDIEMVAAVIAVSMLAGYSQNSPLWLQAIREYSRLAVATAVAAITELAAALVLFLIMGPYGILLGIAMGKIVLLVFAELSLRRLRLDRHLIYESALRPPDWIQRGQTTLAANSFMRAILIRSDMIVITSLLRPEDLAVYWVAYKLVAYICMFAQTLFKPVSTEMAAQFHRAGGLQALFDRVGIGTHVAFAGVAGAVAAIAPWFMRYYGGPQYAGGSLVMAILAVYGMSYAVYSGLQVVILASEDAAGLLKLEMAAGVVGIAATAAGAYWFGLEGVAVGQVVGMVTGVWLARRVARQFVSVDGVVRSALISSGVAVAAYAWTWAPAIKTGLVLAPVAVACGAIVYVYLQARFFSRNSVDVWTSVMPQSLRRYIQGCATHAS